MHLRNLMQVKHFQLRIKNSLAVVGKENSCDLYLKSLPGHEEDEQERDDVPERGGREVEHHTHQGQGQGFKP